MSVKKQIILLTGPSCAGKTEMQNYLLNNYGSDFCKFITSTTRASRPEEKHGEDYYFRLLPDFPKMIEAKELFEHEEVFPGIFYGCEYYELDRILTSNKIPIVVADVKGALKFSGKANSQTIDLSKISPTIFYVDSPIEELIKRIELDNLTGKRKDDKRTLEQRFERMVFELGLKTEFENVISNFGRHQDMTGNELVNQIFKQLKQKK